MDIDAPHRARRLREHTIGRELSSEFSGAQILRRAVKGAVASVDGCDYAGVSLRSRHGEVRTPAWTSPAVWVADAMQLALGDGPSLEPMWLADYVTVDDLSTNQRWGPWAPRVVRLGMHSLISVRLPGGSHSLAALNLYSARAHGFGPKSLDEARSCAAEVLDVIQASGGATGFETAMTTQSLVGMAQGVMRYRCGFEASRALSVLQTYSVKSHVKLQDVAKEFVNSGTAAR